MRISDWSSDVCSSDLHRTGPAQDIALNGTKVGQVWGEDALHLAGILNAFFELGLENRALAAESLDKYRELSMFYNGSEKLQSAPDIKQNGALVCEEALLFLRSERVSVQIGRAHV